MNESEDIRSAGFTIIHVDTAEQEPVAGPEAPYLSGMSELAPSSAVA
jgi:hypothetical protein